MGKKNVHYAYWLVQSFYSIQFTKIGQIRNLFLGVHEPRDTDKLDEMDLEDRKPKADLVISDNTFESIPFPAYNLPKLIAALDSLYPSKNLWDKAKFKAGILYEEMEQPSVITYVERNFHEFKTEEVLKVSKNKGIITNYYYRDPNYNRNNIQWIKGSAVHYQRKIESDTAKYIDQIIVIGKDIKHNHPIIGFRKSWNNFATLIPLIGKGVLQFLTSIAFFVYYPPIGKDRKPIPFISPEKIEKDINEQMIKFHELQFVSLDFFKPSFSELIVKLGE